MKVKCPSCGAIYIHSDDFIKKHEGKIQCFKCKAQFKITDSGIEVIEAPEKKGEDVPEFVRLLSDRGKERFRRYLTDPSFKEHVLLAEELINVGAIPLAEEITNFVLKTEPRSVSGRALNIRCLLANGKREEASKFVEEIEKFAEGNPIVLRALLEFYLETDREKALKYLELYEEERPDDLRVKELEEKLKEPGEVAGKEIGEAMVSSEPPVEEDMVIERTHYEDVKEEAVREEIPEGTIEQEEEIAEEGKVEEMAEEVSFEHEENPPEEMVVEEVSYEGMREETGKEEAEEGIIDGVEFETESAPPEKAEQPTAKIEEGPKDEMDFSSIMQEAELEKAEKKKEEMGEELLDELIHDETELVLETGLPEVEEKKKPKFLPYIIGGAGGLILTFLIVSLFYIFKYEIAGDVKTATPSKILALSKGIFSMSKKEGLARESFDKAIGAFIDGKEEEALNLFKTSAFYNPKNPDALSLFLCFLTRKGEASAEIVKSFLKRAEELGGGKYLDVSKGCVELSSGRVDSAFEKFKNAITKQPDLEITYHFLIESFAKLSVKPHEDFQKIINALPFSGKSAAVIYWKTAEVYTEFDVDIATRYFELALKSAELPEIKISFAKFLLEKKSDYISAKEILENLTRDKKISASLLSSVYLILGKSYYLAGDLESSSEAFRKAFEINPDDITPLYEAVKILISKYKFDEARSLLVEKLSKKAGLSPEFYYFMGRCDFEQRRFFSAVENFKKAASLKKEDEYLLYLAEAYLASDEVKMAEGTIKEFLAKSPEDIRAKIILVKILAEKGEIEEGERIADKIITDFPKNAGGYFAKAIVLKKLKRYEEAENYINKALSIEPNPNYAILASELNMLMKRYDAVLKFASIALSINPQDPRGYILRANAYEAKGELEKAVGEYTKALSFNPSDLETGIHFVEILIFLKRYDEALRVAEKTMEISPNDYRLLYQIGNIYYFKKDIEKSATYMARVIDLKPDFAGAHYFLGLIYMERGILNKAEEELYYAVKYEDKNPLYLYTLSKVLFLEKKAFDALEKVDRALQFSPSYTDAWVLKGKVKSFLGSYSEAKDCFKKAIELDRKTIDGWIGLSEIAKAEGDKKTAYYYLETAERINPSASLFVAKGKLLLEDGNLKIALEYFEKATKLSPSDPIPYFYAGLIYKKMGFKDKAREMFEKAVNNGLSGEERAQLNKEISNW
jgi:tetratricopeptide (TPR) repeat protein